MASRIVPAAGAIEGNACHAVPGRHAGEAVGNRGQGDETRGGHGPRVAEGPFRGCLADEHDRATGQARIGRSRGTGMPLRRTLAAPSAHAMVSAARSGDSGAWTTPRTGMPPRSSAMETDEPRSPDRNALVPSCGSTSQQNGPPGPAWTPVSSPRQRAGSRASRCPRRSLSISSSTSACEPLPRGPSGRANSPASTRPAASAKAMTEGRSSNGVGVAAMAWCLPEIRRASQAVPDGPQSCTDCQWLQPPPHHGGRSVRCARIAALWHFLVGRPAVPRQRRRKRATIRA